MSGLFSQLREALFPAPKSLSELSRGLCALPVPAPKPERVPKAKPKDLYVIDEATAQFGFNFATAQNQNEGSVSELTHWDKEYLKDRGLYGKAKAVVRQNEAAKEMWHTGKTTQEAAASLGLSESWVEKRFGSFSAALLKERGNENL